MDTSRLIRGLGWEGGVGNGNSVRKKKSLSVALLPLTALEVLQRGWKRKDQGWKGSYLELFDVRWGDKTTRRREKRPGGVGVSASWTWWGGKVNRVSDTRAAQKKSNLLKVAVLNKCQSENAASLFKSIRGLGLTVCGGRSPLLWGWGDFFFLLPKFFQSQSGDIVTFSCHNKWRTWKQFLIRHKKKKNGFHRRIRRERSRQRGANRSAWTQF